MRMIIDDDDKTDKIVFSNWWGAGHEAKRMQIPDSSKASHRVSVLKPAMHCTGCASEHFHQHPDRHGHHHEVSVREMKPNGTSLSPPTRAHCRSRFSM